MKYGVSWMHK
jgi:hypothetical protein